MQKVSLQTKSFIILFSIAVIGAYLCLGLWPDLATPEFTRGTMPYGFFSDTPPLTKISPVSNSNLTMAPAPVDTSGWKTFTNSKYELSFKYKPGWKILPLTQKDGFQVLQIDPGAKYYNIKIYISPYGYYVMSGLPTQDDTIGGQPALNINNLLYGMKSGNYYYTFDVGLSLSLKSNFDALVHSVKFNP